MSEIPPPQRGQLVADDYLLQKILSQGPCGTVWRALDQKRGVIVTIRFLPEEFRSNAVAMDRFRRHFPGVQAFRHPHVVSPERFVEDPTVGPFWVARFVEGPLLEDYAIQWMQAEGQFPFRLIFDILRPIASALDDARERQLAYRSLSPRSVVVSPTEGVQLLGFDLTGIVREALDPKLLSGEIERLRFLAPEQIDGQGVSLCTDQYSLGAIAYELFGGRHRTPGAGPLPLPAQPEYVNMSLQRAMYRDPAARFPSCLHFLDGLAGITPVLWQPLAVVMPPSVPQPSVMDSTILMPTIPPPLDVPPSNSSLQDSVETMPLESVSKPVVEALSPLEAITSFEKISSSATRAKATSIAKKINRERRFQKFFHLWNVTVLIVVLVVAFSFRERLFKAWNQRAVQQSGNETTESFLDPPKSHADDSFQTNEDRPEPALKPVPDARPPKKPKEIEFNGPENSPFKAHADTDSPDKVRFVGTSGIGKRIVFVVDASAAMGGGKQTPLSHARKELDFSFQDLNESQRFQVVCFNEEANTLPTEGTDLMIPVSPSNLKRAHAFLETVKGTGRGDPVNALIKAVSLKPDLIFFLSDENAVQLDAAQIELIKKQAGNIPINGVEIGSGMEPDDSPPIKLLANACQGRFQWVNASMHSLARAAKQ